jgi:hypothetical protein
MKRTLIRMALGLAVAIALLGAAEVSLRVLLGPPPAPIRVYGALGDKSGLERTDRGYQVTWQEDIPATLPGQPRDGGPPRAYVAGGSTVHGGSELSPAVEFSAIAGRRAHVLTWNLGTPGLDSHDLVRILDEVNAVSPPDAWVVYTGHNDLGNARFQQRYGSVKAGILAHTQSALEHLRLYATLSRLLRPSGAARAKGIDSGAQPSLTIEQYNVALRHLQANLAHMVWQTEQAGQALVLVVPTCDLLWPPKPEVCEDPPCPVALYETAMEIRADDPAEASRLFSLARDKDRIVLRAPSAVGDTIRSLAETHDHVSVVEAERDLPRHGDLDVPHQDLFLDGMHLTAKGHQTLGQLIAPVLAEALGTKTVR